MKGQMEGGRETEGDGEERTGGKGRADREAAER